MGAPGLANGETRCRVRREIEAPKAPREWDVRRGVSLLTGEGSEERLCPIHRKFSILDLK